MIEQNFIAKILRPLVASGMYKDEQVALKDIIAHYIEGKIETYSSVAKLMEERHGNNFETVTKEREGNATIDFEDDWLEWKAAVVMKEAWQKTLRELLRNAAFPCSSFPTRIKYQ